MAIIQELNEQIAAKSASVVDKLQNMYDAAYKKGKAESDGAEIIKQICVGSLTSLIIPNDVAHINCGAFAKFDTLENITIPFIGEARDSATNAYFGHIFAAWSDQPNESCVPASLKSVIITEDVSQIPVAAFSGCSSLTSITIPDSVTSIGNYAFADCSSLTNINIPSNLITIGKGAFHGCESLVSITIPDSVTSIGMDAFYDCTSLESVYIKDIAAWCNISFESNSTNPLCRADNLYLNGELVTELVIPDGVTSIGDYAFYDCSSLTSVTIPDSVTSIGCWAFYECISLTSVTIGNGVTSIGSGAFYDCWGLKNITIPNSVTSIGDNAFYGCGSLKNVYYTGSEEEWKAISIASGGYSYLKNATIHYNSTI